jgi:hypothetical protein
VLFRGHIVKVILGSPLEDAMRGSIACGLVLFISIGAVSGCLERRERLTIAPDGGVWIQAEFKTNSLDELYQGDAIPTFSGGWAVEQRTQRDAEGRETIRLIATASIPYPLPLPRTFAPRGDADKDLYLQFPTTLKIEHRPDGTYYHVRRLYGARPCRQIEQLQERFVQEPLKALDGIEPGQWTPEQRVAAVRALAKFEVEKTLVFGRAAFLEVTPDDPQDGWLLVQHDLRSFVEQMDFLSLAKLLEPRKTEGQDKIRDEQIQAEAQKFQSAAVAHLKETLQSLAEYDATTLSAFMARYERNKKRYEVSQDLADDKFEITIDMPGQLIAHNADSASGSTVMWTIEGPQLHDCEKELLVSSRMVSH